MIYLNNAVTSYPKPDCVREAVDACVSTHPSSQFRSAADFDKTDIFDECRKNLGRLFGISKTNRIFFTSGATEAMNTIIGGLPVDDMRILTTQTEHNSVLRPLFNLPHFAGTDRAVIAPCGRYGKIEMDALEKLVTDKTGVLIVNHCSNVTGMVQDMERLSCFAKKHGLYFVIDASQSAGCVPIDVGAWDADALIFTGHKSLFGIQGTGGFYIRDGIELHPLKFGGTGRNSAQLTYSDRDYEYEVGTQNAPGIVALNAGAGYILDIGLQNIVDREAELMKAIYSGLEHLESIRVYGTYNENKGPVMCFNVNGLSPSDVAYILYVEYGIIVRAGLHCSPLIHNALGTGERGTVRVSVSYLTTDEDIELFLKAIGEIAGMAGKSL